MLTTQERLGNAIIKALDEEFIDSFNYRVFDDSGKLIGGCAQTAALKGLGCTDEEISWHGAYPTLANASPSLMENINILHCCGKVTARAIAELLKENKVPEDEVDDSVLIDLSKDLPIRKDERPNWN
jgi:hypothetical protein